MTEEKCPICGAGVVDGYTEYDSGGQYKYYGCKENKFHQFSVGIGFDFLEEKVKIQYVNLINEILLQSPYVKTKTIKNHKRYFNFGADYDNEAPYKHDLTSDMAGYPYRFEEKMDRILLNLSRQYPNIEDSFDTTNNYRTLFCETDIIDEAYRILHLLEEIGYINRKNLSGSFYISAQGWKRINELSKVGINQGFIAMAFRKETTEIRKIFKKAIEECHFKVSIIDEIEHNNQIVPEIFAEIKKSKFIVVDVTYPNSGAYYEAGYAQALNKEVIVCCRQQEFDDHDKKPHFDIAQKSMIVWDTPENLLERLKRRISATVSHD